MASSVSDLAEYFGFTKKPTEFKAATHVVHTSTIPLASVMNPPPQQGGVELHHGTLSHDCHCKREHCMFAPKNKPRQPEIIQDSCPCNRNLVPICFLQAIDISSSRLKFEHTSQRELANKAQGFSVCPNGVSLFNDTYPGTIRDSTNLSGWSSVQPYNMESILDHLYWFKKFATERTRTIIRNNSSNFALKTWVFNAIGTIDGLLIKQFMCFADVIGTYTSIAEKTARLFHQLLQDYSIQPDPRVTSKPDTTYDQIKPFLQLLKKCFHSENDQDRLRMLEVGFTHLDKINWFYSDLFRRIYHRIMDLWRDREINGLRSMAWYTRFTMLSKTRVIGHVPEATSQIQDTEYLEELDRKPKSVDPVRIKAVASSVLKGMQDQGIPAGGCRNVTNSDISSKQLDKDRSYIDIQPKFSADVQHTIRQGGKPESGRKLIDTARKEKWKIPIRDLNTGKIIRRVDPPDVEAPGFKWAYKWISMEIVLQAFAKHGIELRPEDSPECWGYEKTSKVFTVTYVRISESGKNRRLIKTSFEVNASTIVGAQMLATELAKGESHKIGLKGSGHAWRFEQRMSSEDPASDFMFDHEDLSLQKNIWGGFEDWRTATDKEEKPICTSMMYAAHCYTAFPVWYGKFCRKVLEQPLEVTKKRIVRIFENGDSISVKSEIKSMIRRGTMMGMQNCKNSLHLLHFAAECLTEATIDKLYGKKRVRNAPKRQHFSENISKYLGGKPPWFEATSLQ